jgi:hypothetical protein
VKDIQGFDGLYAITTDGRVWAYADIPEGGYFKALCGQRYLNAVLYKDGKTTTFLVHRLVAKAFIPNPKNLPVVHHIDGDKRNNRVENLIWVTNRTNVAYHRTSVKMVPKRKATIH